MITRREQRLATKEDRAEVRLNRILEVEQEPNGADVDLKPLLSWDGGTPSADIANRDELYQVVEEEPPLLKESP